MAHITGTDRAQVAGHETTMWVPTTQCGSDAFVDSLGLGPGSNERSRKRQGARGGLAEAVHLRVSRVRSSRRLEAETHRNLEVIWLLRRLRPNFKTIADFRRENREARKCSVTS